VQRGPLLHGSGEYYYTGNGYKTAKREELSSTVDYKRTPIQPKMKPHDLITTYYFTDTKERREQALIKVLTDSFVAEILYKNHSID